MSNAAMVHPHSHDPDLEAHHYAQVARGRFCLVKTASGKFFAQIECWTGLGHLCAMIELSPAAAHALAQGQVEHIQAAEAAAQHAAGRWGRATAVGNIEVGRWGRATATGRWGRATATAGEEVAGAMPSVYDNVGRWGRATATGRWGRSTAGAALTAAPLRLCSDEAEMTGASFTPSVPVARGQTMVGFDLGGFVGDVVQSVEHVAAPVVHAVTNVANATAHAIDSAAKSAVHGVSDAVKTAAHIVAKAHLGDINASKFIGDMVHDAGQGVEAARQAADHLAQGAVFLAQHVDLPKIIGQAIPIPAVRGVAQSVIGLVDPIGHFADAVDALRRGDVNKLRAMAKQEMAEMQGVVSVVPGIGTGVSSALGAATALLDGGSPLEIALRSCYGALPIPPGLREVTDTVFDAVMSIVSGGSITDAALNVARDRIPSGIPRDVFDTLVNVVGHHQPIEKAAEQLAGHYVAQYTQGLVPALTHGLANIVPPNMAAILGKLPAHDMKYASFAPELKRPTPAAVAQKRMRLHLPPARATPALPAAAPRRISMHLAPTSR